MKPPSWRNSFFDIPKSAMLLLSATPYRMLSLDHETDDDHYADFMETLRFLFDGDEARVAEIKDEFRRFRQALYGLDFKKTPNGRRKCGLRLKATCELLSLAPSGLM